MASYLHCLLIVVVQFLGALSLSIGSLLGLLNTTPISQPTFCNNENPVAVYLRVETFVNSFCTTRMRRDKDRQSADKNQHELPCGTLALKDKGILPRNYEATVEWNVNNRAGIGEPERAFEDQFIIGTASIRTTL